MSPQRLVQIVALAAREAILDLTGLEVGLKWPNDLVVDSRKLAGVLAEGAGPGCVVVGIGLNIGWAPEGATGIVALTGRTDVTPHSMMMSLLDRLDLLVDDSDEDVHRRWVSALETLGRRVSVSMPDGRTIVGTAERVDPDGRLVVRDSDSTDHVIDAGDVVHLRSDA